MTAENTTGGTKKYIRQIASCTTCIAQNTQAERADRRGIARGERAEMPGEKRRRTADRR